MHIDEAIRQLKMELGRWDEGTAIALVLDTNVLLDHAHELESFDWRGLSGSNQTLPLVLAVPLVVVDELDELKRSNKPAQKGELPLRTRARRAIKVLETLLESPAQRRALSTQEGRTYLTLIPQALDHAPMAVADSEIVDRALSLEPYAAEVHVVSYDTGLAFRARQVGLSALRLHYSQ